MAELAPHLLKYDYIEDTMFGKIALQGQLSTGQDAQMDMTPLNDQLDVGFSG